MRSRQADGGASWCRVAVLLLTLCLMNESGSAIPFDEFVGYPFNESNGYSVFPRAADETQGLFIPVPFPYFGRTFSYANVSEYNHAKVQCMPIWEVCYRIYYIYMPTLCILFV